MSVGLFLSSPSFFHSQPDVFWTCKKKKKYRKERKKDSSEEIWIVLIWKYSFTSSDLNYWVELAVLREQAQRHRGPRWTGTGLHICPCEHWSFPTGHQSRLCVCVGLRSEPMLWGMFLEESPDASAFVLLPACVVCWSVCETTNVSNPIPL